MLELESLETDGMEIYVNGKSLLIHFAVCLISGGNLGLNWILGSVESFGANYFCRICKVYRPDSRTLVYEKKDLYRTEENYQRDVEVNDVSTTGIKGPCIWNELISFKLTNNPYADIMHDVLEGVADHDMCFIIEPMVKEKWVTHEELNDLVQGFFYGTQEFGNKPPLLCKDKVKARSLGFSASEVLCLVRYFPLMVGHKVPEGDKVREFNLKLWELVDVLFSPTFARSYIPHLNEMIAEHHTSYMSLSNRFLTPKYHNALHYGMIIAKIGPLQPVWFMRSESNYKEMRQVAHVTSSRRNISYTLTLKSSFKNCGRFLRKRGLDHHGSVILRKFKGCYQGSWQL